MRSIHRLPSVPLICSDPYMSIWMPADHMTDADTVHWSGVPKPIYGTITVDGSVARYLGVNREDACGQPVPNITATQTAFSVEYNGVVLNVLFSTPAFPDEPDIFSMPITLVNLKAISKDGKKHHVKVSFELSSKLCYDADPEPELIWNKMDYGTYSDIMIGQHRQRILSLSGDHTTIDWGYLHLASTALVLRTRFGVGMTMEGEIGPRDLSSRSVIAYDDIASVNYFGDLCKAWYRRNGAQITDAIRYGMEHFDEILIQCSCWDKRVYDDAVRACDENYAIVCTAAFRHVLCAHKLIATPQGEMVLLSKENDSNGCIGTVDVSYPSIPIFLKYNPELVNALCRPVLWYSNLPVWRYDFAPHDVGRYPNATGQIYASIDNAEGMTYPPYYLFPASADIYRDCDQMPVEESGNMLIMLECAKEYGASDDLIRKYRIKLDQWVSYLIRFGEDPGEQLCTDDFTGHLAHNANLAVKATVGVACYARLADKPEYAETAKKMASHLEGILGQNGNSPLTLTGIGWSIKYNMMWDKVLHLGLFSEDFYQAELSSYLPRINKYGIPLDQRASYGKTDWMIWTAAMADKKEVRVKFVKPLADFLHDAPQRVPFSDLVYTETGCIRYFFARSVQGGLFALMLREQQNC